VNKVQLIAASILCLIALSHDQRVQNRAIGGEINFQPMVKMDDAKFKDWRARWQKFILSYVPSQSCNIEMGEDMGWVMSPMMAGLYYGYMATRDPKLVELFVNCTDSWLGRAVVEPDGYIGWPKVGAAGTNVDHLDNYYADSLLGEAMLLQYVVLISDQILKTPSLEEKFSAKAINYIKLAEQMFEKWDGRGAWRNTTGGGIITVVLPFGIDDKTGSWTEGYEKRNALDIGFSHPDNKANTIACWLLAMFDVTHKPIYKERAEKWFRLMKSRMTLNDDGTFRVWNYWEPAGPWDYWAYVFPKHWTFVHPNAAYYAIDVDSVVNAYQHGIVFDRRDIERLIITALADKYYWNALVPYNNAIQKKFEQDNNPNGWSGLVDTPWYLALQMGVEVFP
jgi:hypothetical protein